MKSFSYFGILISTLAINCFQNPIFNGISSDKIKVEWAAVSQIGENSALITWECSSVSMGFLNVTGNNYNRVETTLFKSDIHAFTMNGLSDNEGYRAIPSCGVSQNGLGFPIDFRTQASLRTIYNRSIWIVGGMGPDSNPVGAIDYFDPVSLTWVDSVTNVPTPRVNAQIVSHRGKIYIIGGMSKSGSVYSVTRIVEVYDPIEKSWQRLNDMPSTLQGGFAESIGESIFILGGTTSLDMTTGTVLNTVYRFQPEVSTGGTWSSYTSSTSIFGRIDMSSCSYDGSIVFTGGRFYQDGLSYATTDAYVPSLNSTTGKIEASISQARHGASASCYRPLAIDRFKSDPPIFLIAGGSTNTNILQPASSISPSNRFEYLGLTGAANNFVTGTNLPEALYAPSMEIDYDSRKLYLFGGATSINLPTNRVKTLDLSNVGGNPWVESEFVMPRARFGHRAVILSR